MEDDKPITNPYEAAVKWIEDEVQKNGIFKMEREMGDCYDHSTRTTRQVPTGRFTGFTVTSQHTRHRAFNLLQLVMEMRGDEMKSPPPFPARDVKG